MPDFKLPLAGDVSQAFNLWASFLNAMGSQFSLVNVNFGKSSDPSMEQEILSDVGSYGKQLGRIEDALGVLIEHFKPDRELTPKEKKAIHDLRRLLEDIDDVKKRREAQSTRAS